MNFEGTLEPQETSTEEMEQIPVPERIEMVASKILEEEKKKLSEKIARHEKGFMGAAAASLLALIAMLAEKPEAADPDLLNQSFEFFGASPGATIILNSILAGYDSARTVALREKLKKLSMPEHKQFDASGSE